MNQPNETNEREREKKQPNTNAEFFWDQYQGQFASKVLKSRNFTFVQIQTKTKQKKL